MRRVDEAQEEEDAEEGRSEGVAPSDLGGEDQGSGRGRARADAIQAFGVRGHCAADRQRVALTRRWRTDDSSRARGRSDDAKQRRGRTAEAHAGYWQRLAWMRTWTTTALS